MLKRILVGLSCSVVLMMTATSVFAQAEPDFFGALQDNLPRATSTGAGSLPPRGKAETVIVTSTPSVATSSYGAYDAGQDKLSGYVAGMAAAVAALVVAFALGFLLTHPHSSSSDEHNQH